MVRMSIIHVLVNDGSPREVVPSDLYGNERRLEVGGAENALLTMCETWTKRGHKVVLYNDPKGERGIFEQQAIAHFHRNDHRDVLIIFRSPNPAASGRLKCKKVFWSCDQQTCGDYRQLAKDVDQVVCISPFHAEYFRITYGITETTVIDLPVRLWDYTTPTEKIKHRFIFSSVPERGLGVLADMWNKVREAISDATLVITSDHRLWGVSYPANEMFRPMFAGKKDVLFLGAVNRHRLVEEQLQADFHLFPNTYNELFCLAIAESQVAGAYPITSTIGALPTTNMGSLVDGDPSRSLTWRKDAINVIKALVEGDNLEKLRKEVQEKAIKRFDPDVIAQQWEEKVFA
jgi:glycosyltransferase involved in cell wall biosynthesis